MKKTTFALMAIMVSFILIGASCSNQTSNNNTTPPANNTGDTADTGDTANQTGNTADTTATTEEIKLANDPKLGEIFTDSKGMTLYIYNKDTGANSVCTGQCLVYWPIYFGQNLKVPASLDQSDFSEITRTDGQKQTTYKGWPLYYYLADKKPGDTAGEGVSGIWYVVKSNYSVLFSTDTNNYLVDDKGNTLYYFTKDSRNKSTCTGQCLANWPAYTTTNDSFPSTVLNKADFGSITRDEGSKQITFKGWPLYYYIGDNARGEKNGQGLNSVWYIVDPAKQAQAK